MEDVIYPVWTMNKLKSTGFGKILKHLLSTWCMKSCLPTSALYPKILLSRPTDITIFLCWTPATPITAEVWIFICNGSDFHLFSSFSLHSMTVWSVPAVTKLVFSHGRKTMLLIAPLTCGLSSKKSTCPLCQPHIFTSVIFFKHERNTNSVPGFCLNKGLRPQSRQRHNNVVEIATRLRFQPDRYI